jgi:hypothetical protein
MKLSFSLVYRNIHDRKLLVRRLIPLIYWPLVETDIVEAKRKPRIRPMSSIIEKLYLSHSAAEPWFFV